MAPPTQRRLTTRIPNNGNLNVESVSGGQSLGLVDVGLGGFAVRSVAPLPLESVMSYRFTTPDGRWAAVLRARAQHCTLIPAVGEISQHYLIGLAFVNTGAAAVSRELAAMLDHAGQSVSFS